MQFRFSAEDEAFRAELRGLIRDVLPPDWEGGGEFGDEAGEATFEVGVRVTRALAERKWLAMAWPKEYGGLEAPHMQQLIFNEEVAYNAVPNPGYMGIAWVGPALMLYGTPEQKERFIPRITSGEDRWCTLYSEPAAGSDLAALQARAVLDGDEWVINGQKIWTSGAHHSNWGWLAARTDPDAPKHKGISVFLLPINLPGIRIVPIKSMVGYGEFAHVFFEDVRIPKDNLVGELNRGWYQVAVALDFERSGIAAYAGARRTLEDVVRYLESRPGGVRVNAQVRNRLADRLIELNVGTMIAYRIPWMQSQGIIPNYEASVSKLFGSEFGQRVAQTGVQVLGLYGGLEPKSKWAALKGRLERSYMNAVGSTIAAGTSEIQRNIIGTRGLGLPRE